MGLYMAQTFVLNLLLVSHEIVMFFFLSFILFRFNTTATAKGNILVLPLGFRPCQLNRYLKC